MTPLFREQRFGFVPHALNLLELVIVLEIAFFHTFTWMLSNKNL